MIKDMLAALGIMSLFDNGDIPEPDYDADDEWIQQQLDELEGAPQFKHPVYVNLWEKDDSKAILEISYTSKEDAALSRECRDYTDVEIYMEVAQEEYGEENLVIRNMISE